MIEQKDAQRCNNKCCCYLNGEEVTNEMFERAAPRKNMVLGVQAIFDTVIPCLKADYSQKVIARAGFYTGQPFAHLPQQPVRLSLETFVYHAITHRYLRLSTPEDDQAWGQATSDVSKAASDSLSSAKKSE
jgi:hypothetical protein